MLLIRVKKWLKIIEKKLFFYKNGFFELPYLCNSPQIMLESLKRLPVHKFNKLEQAIYTRNPLTTGIMRYRELEEGFWIIAVEIKFHANVHTIATFDNHPRDYYYLSHSVYKSGACASINDTTSFQNNDWSFYMPGHEIDAYHYKGVDCLVLQFAFTQAWFNKNFCFDNIPKDNSIKQFLKSGTGFNIWKDLVSSSENISKKIWKTLKEEKEGYFNIMSVKLLSLEMISEFFNSFLHYERNNLSLNEADKKCIAKAESIILNHLTKPFPGIESISKTVNLSSTKLKSSFKSLYGATLYTYYKEKQMILALQLIKNNQVQIKEVAYMLGYESPSKFTAAFKKYHHILPSEATTFK